MPTERNDSITIAARLVTWGLGGADEFHYSGGSATIHGGDTGEAYDTNVYGTKGVTGVLDYRNKRWSFLFGWDRGSALPVRWPGWSVQRCWSRSFVGVPGGVAEMDQRRPDAAVGGAVTVGGGGGQVAALARLQRAGAVQPPQRPRGLARHAG